MRATLSSERVIAGIVVAIAMALAAVYGVVTPMWEAPDEVGHMAYITHLVRHRTLPVQQPGRLGEDHQPPLYYVLGAVAASVADLDDESGRFRFNPAIVWGREGGTQINAALHGPDERFPYTGQALALHLTRLVSVLCAGATVALTIGLGWRLFPELQLLGSLAGVLVGANPQFLFIAGSVSNDNLVTVISAGLLLCATTALLQRPRLASWIIAGVLTAVGLLTKLSVGPVALATFAALALHAVACRRYRVAATGVLVAAIVVVLGAGWWFHRNVLLYGDPVGWSVFSKDFAGTLRSEPLRFAEYRSFLRTQFRSFWATFGWMTVTAPPWFYAAMLMPCVGALFGFASWAMGRSDIPRPKHTRRAVGFLCAAAVIHELYLVCAIQTFGASWYQGRYLFPVLPAFGVIMSLGLLALVPLRLRPRFVAVTSLAAFAIALSMPFTVIAPAYAARARAWVVDGARRVQTPSPMRAYALHMNLYATPHWARLR